MAQRRKREEQRSKALARDHQQNLARIRDLRAKFKQEPMEDVKPALDKTREPDLGNLVPEYDLQMFRDAQALASERLEQELKSLPSTRGTKSIEMGRFEMEVWYLLLMVSTDMRHFACNLVRTGPIPKISTASESAQNLECFALSTVKIAR